jgi:hypothetical protein
MNAAAESRRRFDTRPVNAAIHRVSGLPSGIRLILRMELDIWQLH